MKRALTVLCIFVLETLKRVPCLHDWNYERCDPPACRSCGRTKPPTWTLIATEPDQRIDGTVMRRMSEAARRAADAMGRAAERKP